MSSGTRSRKSRDVLAIIIAVAFAIVGVAACGFQNDGSARPETDVSAGLIIGTNMIYVEDQVPGQSVSIADVRLEKPGFVVIFDDQADQPKNILGSSVALPSGISKNFRPIVLSRMTRSDETLYAMLYLDDGDGVFDLATDTQVYDSLLGQPMMMMFGVNLDASKADAINP